MKSVKAHENTKLIRKKAEKAQGKTKRTQEPISKKTHGCVKPLGKEYMAGLKRLGKIKSLQQE